jgi:hypothetical protein
MNTNETMNYEKDAQWAQKHNARRMREAVEEKKREEEAIERRRQQWNNTPDEMKTCLACGLKLDGVTVARITASPTSPRRHSFCDTFAIPSGVIPGLVGLLKEVFGADEIPLDSLRQVIGAWQSQKGFCAVSRIKLAFPVEEKTTEKTTKDFSSLTSQLDQEVMRLRETEERSRQARHSELHTPVLNYSESGELRLVSKTVARMIEGLTPVELREIVRTLNEELKAPESQSWNPQADQRQLKLFQRQLKLFTDN